MNDYYRKAIIALGWVECTLWFRFKGKLLSYNHLEYGHCQNEKPTAMSPEQAKSWNSHRWSKRFTYAERGLGGPMRVLQ